MKRVIKVENVSFSYGRERVIEHAHFHIEEGSFASFIGPNGGGKTTLAKLILGILQPQEGHISIFGMPAKEGRKLVGYVPQYSHYDAEFPISVHDIVLMGRLEKPLGFYSRKDREVADRIIREVDILELKNKPFSVLSGGQKQRVLIARALAANPEILILDEPTANIDPTAEHRLYSLLTSLNETMTIILISHDLEFVSEHVEKVICIDRQVYIHPTGELDHCKTNRYLGRQILMVNHKKRLEETDD